MRWIRDPEKIVTDPGCGSRIFMLWIAPCKAVCKPHLYKSNLDGKVQ
jgi:hypothetical protein